LGGVSQTNLKEYLSESLVCGIGGSWLAKRETIAAGDWATIEQDARAARTVLDEVRS
jgi:2-dehydro-3-deoxyphosphogluconate aldolase/(4S)-4-hydroxy-2-oxoglutarate aldolase